MLNMGEKHMDFKKLFRKDEKAVSPVIGVILMVAITVILAAAIGSSVFSKGTAEAAPQANLNMKADGDVDNSTGKGTVRIEHLGGDTINFKNVNITAYVGSNYKPVNIASDTTLNVGDVKTFTVGNDSGKVSEGEVVNIKMVDKTTNQLICDKNIRF